MVVLTSAALMVSLRERLGHLIDMGGISDEFGRQVVRMESLLFTELDSGGGQFWLEREALQTLLEPAFKDSLALSEQLSDLEGLLCDFIQWQLPRLALITINHLKNQRIPSWALVMRGRVMQQLGDFNQARELYQKAIGTGENNASAHFHIGYLEMLNKHALSAIDHFDRCLSIDGSYAGANLNKGYCLYQIERFNEAVQCLRQEIEHHQLMIPAYLTLARCYIANGNDEEALNTCRQLDAIEPDLPENDKLRAVAALKTENFILACQSIERCFNRGYHDLDMLHMYVDSLFKQELWQQVLEHLGPLREVDNCESQFIEYEFVSHYRLGNWELANQSYLALLCVWPGAQYHYQEEIQHIAAQPVPISLMSSA